MGTAGCRTICAFLALLTLAAGGPATQAGAAAKGPAKAPASKSPASNAPALEAAASALAEGRLDAARDGFQSIVKGAAASPWIRGLAFAGLAETALARKDTAAAIQTWKQLAADAAIPQALRDEATRRIQQTRRTQSGKPARDPADYRAKLPLLSTSATTIHVAPGGKTPAQGADGSGAKPFGTLEAARDAIRGIKKSHGGKLPEGGVRIAVHAGEYPVQQSLRLTSEDSGTADAPVVYQASSDHGTAGQAGSGTGEGTAGRVNSGTGEGTAGRVNSVAGAPIFRGGVTIPRWQPVSDAKVREEFDASVRERVVEADLKALGVKNLGDATALRQCPELFCGGVPQTLARWPNEGFVKTGAILGKDAFKVWNSIPGCKDGKFRYVEDRPSRWAGEPDVRLHGYWFWDWYEEFQKVAAIDASARTFTLATPYSQYGYREGQRYYAVNLLCEIDRPGEWYLDRGTSKIYWLPPESFDAAKTPTVLSVLAEPFVSMENVEHVILLGLTFAEARGDGLHVRGGAECLVAGCTLRQLGGDAIVVEGGRKHGVFGSSMHTLGCGGVKANGGDRKTLAPGSHFVENCVVRDISRRKRTYTPAVLLDGCGNRVAHNLFERMPSSALRIEGNDQLIELNAIRQAVAESDDQGGLDIFGNPLYRGVVIRWNRWSDIVGGTHCGAAGVRLDDMISGVSIYGNVFERCGAVQFGGVQVHGGHNNLIDDNLFLDCFAGISFSRWGEKRWLEGIAPFLAQAGEPAYASRYPELARIRSGADVNQIARNVFLRSKDVFLRDGGVEQAALNVALDEPLSVERLADAAAIAADPRLRRILFEPIPVPEIGPYAHPWAVSPTADAASGK
jgi:hypothetical protein